MSHKGIQLQKSLGNRKDILCQDAGYAASIHLSWMFNKSDGTSRILPPSHRPQFHPSPLSTNILPEERSNRGFDDQIVPDSPEERSSHVLCGADTRHIQDQADAGEAIRLSVDNMKSAQRTTTATVTPKDAGTISQACDHCQKNNKTCRLKLPGTCFNCSARKKKCTYSGKPMSTGKKHVIRSVDAAAEMRPEVAQSSTTPSFDVEQRRPHSNPSSRADFIARPQERPQERTTLPTHSQVSPTPSSLIDTRIPPVSIAVSTIDGDAELPLGRSIRSSSLVRRRVEEPWGDRGAKQLRVFHSR